MQSAKRRVHGNADTTSPWRPTTSEDVSIESYWMNNFKRRIYLKATRFHNPTSLTSSGKIAHWVCDISLIEHWFLLVGSQRVVLAWMGSRKSQSIHNPQNFCLIKCDISPDELFGSRNDGISAYTRKRSLGKGFSLQKTSEIRLEYQFDGSTTQNRDLG